MYNYFKLIMKSALDMYVYVGSDPWLSGLNSSSTGHGMRTWTDTTIEGIYILSSSTFTPI